VCVCVCVSFIFDPAMPTEHKHHFGGSHLMDYPAWQLRDLVSAGGSALLPLPASRWGSRVQFMTSYPKLTYSDE
jgi:hypothetical protein